MQTKRNLEQDVLTCMQTKNQIELRFPYAQIKYYYLK